MEDDEVRGPTRAEKARARTATWYSDPANAARQKARQQADRAADPEKVRAKGREYSQRWRDNNPHSRHVSWLRHKYQMTREQVEHLLAIRDLCESCGVEKATVIDHDHATMAFRGQLCNGCNSAAGMLKDEPERAIALAAYLSQFATEDADA
jgi:hypothetical protein